MRGASASFAATPGYIGASAPGYPFYLGKSHQERQTGRAKALHYIAFKVTRGRVARTGAHSVFANPSPSIILSTARNLAQGKLHEAISIP